MNLKINDRIIIIDNFFEQSILDLIKKDISNLNFTNRSVTVSEEEKGLYQKMWDRQQAVQEVEEKLQRLV